MKGNRLSTMRRKALSIAAVLTALALVALAIGAQGVAARPEPNGGIEGTNWELGNFCVDDYQSGSVCTANDVVIANISPSIEEACMAIGDTATVQFTVKLLANATTRYDIGLFVATDGGSAQTGNSCYHDFLQPGSTTAPWAFPPYREYDPDACADMLQNDGPIYYTFQQVLTIQCTDANNDGVVDPFSTCTSWDNVSKVDCFDVKGAFPNNKAKCRCETVTPDPPILIYYGYDFGDLPDTYGTLKASDGAHHAIQDDNHDGVPNTLGGVAAVWLGPTVDFSPFAESDGIPGVGAVGDDLNFSDDEDGVGMTGTWDLSSGQFLVNVNSSDGTCSGCKLGFWIDWNLDGDFADEGESYLQSVGFGDNTVSFAIPSYITWQNWPASIYVRFRLYAGNYDGGYLPTGLVVNGEVEDYRFASPPTAVDMLSFLALGGDSSITLFWETTNEIDNLGFNVYRATSVNGARVKLNAQMIPSLVAPGSPFGAAYEYADTTVRFGRTYYYWLEDVDIFGRTRLYGPVDAKLKHQISKELPPSQPKG